MKQSIESKCAGPMSRLAVGMFAALVTAGAAFAAVEPIPTGEPGPIGGNMMAFSSIPPLVNVEGSEDEPNVMIILDNSNSMDESPNGEAVGSANPASKSEVARNAIKAVLDDTMGEARVGLMTYQQGARSGRQLHNAYYYVSYDPANWNPDFVPQIPVTHPIVWNQYRFRTPNVDDPGNWMYYNIALPYYSGGNDGSAHCFSAGYNFAEPMPGRQTQNYNCYGSKTGTSDANVNYTGFIFSAGFVPTDSDFALGFNYFGQHLSWKHVGSTWFNNSSPGRGFLDVNIADLDGPQRALLDAKLATSQFAINTKTPIQNAGLTPIEGTLLTALDYFTGVPLPAGERGIAQTAVPENICLQKDAVILVTDGLPTNATNGSFYPDFVTGINAVAAAAGQLAAQGIKVYVIGFALPTGVDPALLDAIAAAGDTVAAYDARDADTLSASLDIIFAEILARPSSATAAAVVANSSTGTGAVYQALYEPQRQDNLGNEVEWIGTVHSLWIDDFGLLREDNPGGEPDAMLGNYSVDPVIEFFFDEDANTTRFRRVSSNNADDFEPGASTTHELEELSTVWNAKDQLAALNNLTTQRSYGASADSGRHILTWVDEDRDSLVDSNERKTFVYDANNSTTINAENFRYLNTADPAEAAELIDYIRGEEIDGLRSRTIDYDEDGFTEVMRMGDVVHSTPTVVGAPGEAFDLLYGDGSYADFRIAYANRRSVTFVGANDGAVHALNAGFFTGDAFTTSTQLGETAHPLGSELWAYVPGNLLPHLRWLKDEEYQHVYYVDGKPRIFDAKVFPADATHVGGWGTIAVFPFRLGGGDLAIDVTGAGNNYTFRSVYVVMDITDPESPPVVLREIRTPLEWVEGTYTTAEPTVVAVRDPTDETPNKWFLILGSGPTDLNSAYNESATRPMQIDIHDLSITVAGNLSMVRRIQLGSMMETFSGSMATADWDLDFKADAVYFGTVRKPAAAGDPATGSFLKLNVGESSIPGNWTVQTLNNTGLPMVARPSLGAGTFDDVWVFGGTGRFFVNPDKATLEAQKIYGIKDTAASGGDSLPADNLIDVTGVQVFTDGAVNGGPAGAAAADGDTDFEKLVNYVDDPANDIEGWFVNLPADGDAPAWRVVNSQALFGGVLLTPAFQPGSDQCLAQGSSVVIGQFFKTGTGAPEPQIFGIVEGSEVDGVAEVETVLELGQGLGASPSIHAGRGTGPDRATACTQTSTGAILCDGVTTLVPILSGEISWREFTD